MIDFGADLTERLALPDLRMPRVDVPNSGPVAPEEVLFAFQATFRQNQLVGATADALDRALQRVQAAGRRRVPDQPVRHLHESVRLPRRDPGDDRPSPLHAVLLGPVRRPARGLRRAALEGRRPDVCLLPARGPVPAPPDGGRARPGRPTTPPTTATGSCRRRPSATARTARARCACCSAGWWRSWRASPRRPAGQGRPRSDPEPLGRRAGVGQGDPVLLRPGRNAAGVRAVGPGARPPAAGQPEPRATGPTSTRRPRRRSSPTRCASTSSRTTSCGSRDTSARTSRACSRRCSH